MPFNIGPFELLLVLILALLILGPGKLPEVGSAIGKALREFRQATTEVGEAVKAADLREPLTSAKPAPTSRKVEGSELAEPEGSRAPAN